jgi:hypothetical protein
VARGVPLRLRLRELAWALRLEAAALELVCFVREPAAVVVVVLVVR